MKKEISKIGLLMSALVFGSNPVSAQYSAVSTQAYATSLPSPLLYAAVDAHSSKNLPGSVSVDSAGNCSFWAKWVANRRGNGHNWSSGDASVRAYANSSYWQIDVLRGDTNQVVASSATAGPDHYWPIIPGITYYFKIFFHDFSYTPGGSAVYCLYDNQISTRFDFPQPPLNNDFANYSSLSDIAAYNSTLTVSGTTTSASSEPGEPSIGGEETVWYKVIPRVSGYMSIKISGANFSPKVGVFIGTDYKESLSTISSVDTRSYNGTVYVGAQADTPYYIAVASNFLDKSGPFSLNVTALQNLPTPLDTAPRADSDAPFPLWALFGIGAGMLGIVRRRIG